VASAVDPARHADRRRHILDAAAGLFARHGYERTTTAQICRAAGISPGNLYHYFASKQELFIAVLTQDEGATAELVGRVPDQDPLAAVLDLVDHLAAAAAHPVVPSLVLEAMLQAHREPSVRAVLERVDRGEREGLVVLLRRAAAAGAIAPDLDVEETATWLGALVSAVYLQGATDPAFEPHAQLANLRRTAHAYLVTRA